MYSSPAEYVLRRPDDAPDSAAFFVFIYRSKREIVHEIHEHTKSCCCVEVEIIKHDCLSTVTQLSQFNTPNAYTLL